MENAAIDPAHHIQELTLSHNGRPIATCQMGASISKDPYFAFMLNGGAAGDTITIAWTDSLGNHDSKTHADETNYQGKSGPNPVG